MLDAIRPLVDHGFAVHLLKPESKAPAMGYGWAQQPVLDFAGLKERYRKGQNFGVRLGQPSVVDGRYLHVIDMDIRVEGAEKEARAELRRLFPRIDDFPCVISGSGGESRHFYFLCDRPFPSKKLAHSRRFFRDDDSRKHWEWEIELFGTGKQVVLPPSIHPETKKPYRWLIEFDFDGLTLGLCDPFIPASAMPEAVEADPDNELDDDAAELLALVSPPRGLTHEEIRDVLAALPADEWCEDRDQWLRAGMAVHHETSGSDEGFDIWCEWSEQSAKFDEEDSRRVWRSFKNKATKVTMGTLLRVVRDSGLDYEQCKRRLEKMTAYKEALTAVAGYDFLPSEVSSLIPTLQTIAEAAGRRVSKSDVTKDLKIAIKDARLRDADRAVRSIEQWLADEVLRLFYNGGKHILSFNGTFWIYENGYWYMPDQNIIANRVVKVISAALGSGEEIAEPLRVAIRASGRGESLNALSNAIVGVLAKSCVIDQGEDPLGLCREVIPSVINCTNGELWFDDDGFTFRKHNARHLFTHQIGCEYDNTAECPEWDRALEMIFEDKEDRDEVIRHLHEIMGYILQGSRSHAIWTLFYGTGSNGKSFVAQVLQSLLGPRSWVSRSLADYGRSRNTHVEAGLVGKLMLVDDDYRKGELLPDDTIKKISEAKPMTANPKGKDEFNFVCRTVPLILTNHWPKTRDSSYGMERRAMVFHFSRTITDDERDAGLRDRIVRNEMPGVLNHCIRGWLRLQERGSFDVPVSCLRAKASWLSKRNSFSLFVSEHLEITGNDSDRVPALDLWEVFREWVQQDNSGAKWGRNSFYEEVGELRGVTRHRIDGVQQFHGVGLRNTEALNLPADMLDDLTELEDDLI